jgi:hypothetical protein
MSKGLGHCDQYCYGLLVIHWARDKTIAYLMVISPTPVNVPSVVNSNQKSVLRSSVHPRISILCRWPGMSLQLSRTTLPPPLPRLSASRRFSSSSPDDDDLENKEVVSSGLGSGLGAGSAELAATSPEFPAVLVPISSSLRRPKRPDLFLCKRLVSGSSVGSAPYDPATGTILQKKKATKISPLVATARTSRKPAVLPGKSHEERQEKKKALNPKAANGMAVAVPR